MKLDNRTKRLIAVGASIAANCQPCLEFQVGLALEDAIDYQEIEEAMAVGKGVRNGAASNMDTFASCLKQGSSEPVSIQYNGCECRL
jgi:AhpD family alkylhydroperoxidase